MHYFKNISIRYKILYIAFVGVLGFTTYLIFNYFAIERNNVRLQDIKNHQFPILELIDDSITQLESTKNTLTLAISVEQEEIIEEADEIVQKVHANFSKIAEINPNLSDKMAYYSQIFDEYYNIAQSLTLDIILMHSTLEIIQPRAIAMNVAYKNIVKLLNNYRHSKYVNFTTTINMANSDLKKTLYLGLVIGILLITTLVLAAFFISNVITKGIRNVMIAFQKMVAGNYSYEVDYAGEDEIGQLAKAYKNTSQRLHNILEKLKLTKLEAESANHAKSNFLANMSHELRTPLNAIIGYSEMLMEDLEMAGSNTHANDASKIQTSGTYLLSLINQILDLSKIEAGKMELVVEEFAMENLIKNISETSQPLIRMKNNTLSIDCNLKKLTLKTDKTKITQALYNLISNAAKFTTNGDIKLSISQDNADKKKWVSFKIQDTGIGMSPNQVEKIFEPFVQADRTTSQNFGGTGLGLTLTKEFLNLLGGDIYVQTEYGKGTTFTIRIPQTIDENRVSNETTTPSTQTIPPELLV